jgi:hypothetical protein
MAQSMTTIPPSANVDAFLPNGLRDAVQRGGEVLTSFQAYQTAYIASTIGMAPPAARTEQPRPPRQRNRGTAETTAAETSSSRRSAPGGLNENYSKVLAKIVTNQGIDTAKLIANFRSNKDLKLPRYMGNTLSRLSSMGLITGTPKTGPWHPTPAGVEANAKQPAVLSERRRRTSRTTTQGTTAEIMPQQPTAATGTD